MNIYKFEYHSGEADWVYAPNKKEAKKFYLDFTGCGNLEGYTITKVPKKEWKGNFILDINEIEPDPDDLEYDLHYPDGHREEDYHNGYKIEMTFEEYAETHKYTDIIATTEF